MLGAGWRKALVALPIVWFGSDMLENTLVFSMISQYPVQNEVLGGILGFVTVAKFSLLLLSIAGPAVFLVVLKKGPMAASHST